MEFEGDTQDGFSGRTMDIELGGQEIITIELDTLDEDPNDFIDLLTDAQCEVSTWVKLACEYLKKDLVGAADKIARKALQVFEGNGSTQSIPPTYYLLANIQLALARKAPKLILPNARRDDMSKEKPKEFYYESVVNFLRHARTNAQKNGMDPAEDRALLIRGIYQLATASLDDALSSFESVLSNKPTNIVALLGKARVLFARRQHAQSLKSFQQVLLLSPNCVPDPRIGIGLCFWQMNQKAKAKAAWERALEVNPKNWAALLLLGLEGINASKDLSRNEADRKMFYFHGTKYTESAFRLNQKNASTANALFSILLQKGDIKRAQKLAERTIQFADILGVVSAGHIHAGQLAQADGLTSDAIKHFNAALKGNPKNVLAAMGLAQMQVQNDEIAAAIHTLDTLTRPPNNQKPLEALVMLASLRGNPRPGISATDAATERSKARDLYDQVLKVLEGATGDKVLQSKAQANFGDDVDMFIEIARLWQEDNQDRLRSALNSAVRASEANGYSNPSLLNNMAVVKHLDGDFSEARSLYENALTSASNGVTGQTPSQIEAISTTVLYNLARAYEDQGEVSLAREAYEKLISRHPEYIDAKVRLAHILVGLNQINDAHEHYKECLASQKNNLNLRASYSQFLVQHYFKASREFVIATLREFDNHDVYALCAAGHIFFHEARENRDSGAKAAEDRRKGYLRSAEVFEKALQLDPTCAFAAQGLAIIAAEDVLDMSGGKSGSDVVARRLQSARDALDILGKVRESIGSPSVYINMGHCYFFREEYDRAIDSYETASKRSQDGYDLVILQNLCRAWYAKANKDQSYLAIKNALDYAQKALHIAPNEKVTLYNLAMIEQKGLEMLLTIPPAKRTLVDLQRAVEQGVQAQKLFASLAADRSSNVPYDRDIADQRRKYGDSLMRKVEDNLEAQRQYEGEQDAKVIAARQKRQEEKERLEALEREREEALRLKAEHLAEERRKAREETQALMAAMAASSDEEKEKRPRKKKQQKAAAEEAAEPAGSGDEAAAPPEPKKRRKGKLRKEGDKNGNAAPDVGGEEEEALFSGEDEDRPAKKRSQKKRVVRDDDEEDAPESSSRPKKKQYKSKETISDSDEEMS